MTPELQRALRAHPRLRKRLRERTEAPLLAVEEGRGEAIVRAAAEWAEAEKASAADLAKRERKPPQHRVTFLIEEAHYRDFCSTAAEHQLTPSEVARRYCISGITFSHVLWHAMRQGKLSDVIVISPARGLNLAQLALPRFGREL